MDHQVQSLPSSTRAPTICLRELISLDLKAEEVKVFFPVELQNESEYEFDDD
jgi:hypothetical protein